MGQGHFLLHAPRRHSFTPEESRVKCHFSDITKLVFNAAVPRWFGPNTLPIAPHYGSFLKFFHLIQA